MIEFKDICLQEGIVVNCRTEEQANNLLKWADSKGLKWISKESFLSINYWDRYEDKTCYELFDGTMGPIGFYNYYNFKSAKYKILSYEEALLNTEEISKNDLTAHYDFWYTLTDEDIKNGKIKLDPYKISSVWKLGERDNNSGILFHILKTITRIGKKKGNSIEREINAIIAQAEELRRFI